eukprot:3691421-Pyramimonas_sp.AAC.1
MVKLRILKVAVACVTAASFLACSCRGSLMRGSTCGRACAMAMFGVVGACPSGVAVRLRRGQRG